jgi:hypothetical protein
MIRLGNHWTITLADLSLILFIIAASALEAPAVPAPPAALANPLPAEGEPVAVYRAGAGAPPLAEWLAQQAGDDRLQLTIIARYTGTDAAAQAAQAAALAAQAGPQMRDARIVVEPGETAEMLAVLAYDHGGAPTP